MCDPLGGDLCSYLGAVGTELAKPSWMSGTGIPLLATLAGLLFAYRFLRQQLASDRILRSADRRQQAANQLGAALLAGVKRFSHTAAVDTWWESNYWRNGEALQQSVSEALIELQDTALTDVMVLLDDIAAGWQACLSGAHRLDPTPDRVYHSDAVRHVLRPYLEALTNAALELRRWDGLGAVPEPQSTVPHAMKDNDWYLARRAEYTAEIGGERGVRLRKPAGEALWSDRGDQPPA